MTNEIKRTPAEWSAMLGVVVLDPDGWDRKNFAEDWAKPLTADEFNEKLMWSTIDWSGTREH